MSDFIFFTLLIIVSILFIFRNKIYIRFIKIEIFKKTSIENFNISIIVLFFLIILIGTVTNDKDRFKNISNNFDSLKTPDEQKRPNPMFDVNTYNDSHEWGN